MSKHTPVQVYLKPSQHQQLKLIAVHETTDVSELVRQAVDALILSKTKAHYAGELKRIQTRSE